MIATLVIGLREGLEATLIVGIIAAFLKRNRIPMWPMWLGVGTAVALSIAVGVVLDLVEQALPQAQQEGMEAIIGSVAVVFVTTMIVWMRKHAKNMRAELEAEATAAASRGTAWALAGMAFLAVLKEGFETSVFLLATFQASSNTGLAALGALIGVLGAVVIGFLLYTGGVRLNLAKFFTGTGVFLVFVAAGLVMTALRTAHEAGWILIGQQRTVDLSWLAPNGSVRGALITGILGIQPDPRVVEVLGWFCYLVPVLALALWPRAWRPSPTALPRVRAGLAAGFAVAAIVLALAVHAPDGAAPQTVSLGTGSGSGTATVSTAGTGATVRTTGSGASTVAFGSSARRTATHDGVSADRWRTTSKVSTASRPATVTVDQLVTLFGRIPVGISPDNQPGPYTANWSAERTTTLWTVGSGILDAKQEQTTVVTLSGGGLGTSRTYTLDETRWSVPSRTAQATAAAVQSHATSVSELRLWNTWLPIALAIAALWQVFAILRSRRQAAAAAGASTADAVPADAPADSDAPQTPSPTTAADDASSSQSNPPRSSPYVVR
ncbi:iron uptake transporter permease EfeU [Frondihabitans australicus]|uniref:High-affinity iron transporter n=1 Tax=Frondihabitans australicus TaxID=386892 RepID=A0A495IIS4_9MICO|nr:iron uptake transporter permease EfeU [Frondihabitans australicus]RKR75211.1 high-affinity iron transporter [Frondihabitans australicus]